MQNRNSYVRFWIPVYWCLPKSRILWLRKYLLVSPTQCHSLAVNCEWCSAFVHGGGLLQMCLYGRAGLSGVLSHASLLACCAVVQSDPMRRRWWALQKGYKLFQMEGLWWSAQLPQTWSSYSISPARHPVITLSLPLCYAIPDPPAVSGFSLSLSLTFFTCQTHHSVFSSSFFSTLLCLQKYYGSTTLQWW